MINLSVSEPNLIDKNIKIIFYQKENDITSLLSEIVINRYLKDINYQCIQDNEYKFDIYFKGSRIMSYSKDTFLFSEVCKFIESLI